MEQGKRLRKGVVILHQCCQRGSKIPCVFSPFTKRCLAFTAPLPLHTAALWGLTGSYQGVSALFFPLPLQAHLWHSKDMKKKSKQPRRRPEQYLRTKDHIFKIVMHEMKKINQKKLKSIQTMAKHKEFDFVITYYWTFHKL